MKITIVRELKLSEGQTALELDHFPRKSWIEKFNEWAKDCQIDKYVKVENFYTSEMYGDIDYPSIQIKRGAPRNVKAFVILRWA